MRTYDGHYTGWLPRAVRVKQLARRLNHLLLAHAVVFGGNFRPQLTRRIDGIDYEVHDRGRRLPFGWVSRRLIGYDTYRVGPWWYFLPRDIGDWWWSVRCSVLRLAAERGMVELWVRHGYLVRTRWWPHCPRFE